MQDISNITNKCHMFSVEDAKKYGLMAAPFLYNLRYWLQYNQANRRNYHDGRYWSFNGNKALSELMPYYSEDQLDRIIKKLKESKVLLVGNYNKKGYDRTRWFSLNENWVTLLPPTNEDINMQHEVDNARPSREIAEWLPRNRGMAIENPPAESRNGFLEIAEPIPDIKLKIKNSNKEYICASEIKSESPKEKEVSVSTTSIPSPLEVFNLFNEKTKGILPTAKVLNDTRKKSISTLTKKHLNTLQQWSIYLDAVLASKFHTGDNTREWRADIDFVLKESKCVKILEAHFSDIKSKKEVEEEIEKERWKRLERELTGGNSS